MLLGIRRTDRRRGARRGVVAVSRLVLPPELTGPAHPEWFAARREGVTASEIAAILGLSPWDSAFAIYHRKQGTLDDGPDTDVLSLGRHLEPWIAERWAARRPYLDVVPAGLYARDDRPWQLATPDRLLFDDTCACNATGGELCTCPVGDDEEPVALLEIKHSASWDGWGDEGSDEIPVYYRAQVLWQMDAVGVDTAYVACLFLSSRTIREYVLTMDDAARADLAVMVAAAEDFRARLADEEPPPVDGSEATTAALQELNPDVEDTEVIISDALVREYRLAKDTEKAAKECADTATNRLRLALGDRKRAIDFEGAKVATRSVYDQNRIDVDRLRRERPDIAAAYSTTTTVDKITAAPAKKRKTIA